MADYSIDDILAELDAKKAGKTENAAVSPKKEAVQDLSATAIINGGKSDDMSATAILKGLDADSGKAGNPPGKPAPAKAEPAPPIVQSAEESTHTQVSQEINLKKLTGGMDDVDKVLSETDSFSISDDTAEQHFEAPAPIKEFINPKPAKEAPEAVLHTPEETPQLREKRLKLEEESRRLLLKKERENSDPDDMLDLVNPLEVKEKVISQVKEKEQSSFAQYSSMYSGNTQGLAGGDIKAIQPTGTKLGEKTDDEKDAEESEAVKEYPARRTTTGLIEKINKSLEEKRKENLRAHRTITLSDIKTKQTAVAHPLNIDYKKQIIESTGSLPEENPVVEQEKIDELSAAKKHKLKDFVLEDGEEENDKDEADEDEEEFNDYDSTGQIWADLCASHKGLKIRAVMLSVITAFSVIVSLLNDFDLFGALGLGDALSFINIRGDVTSLIYVHLVCGILGFATCSTVLSNGLIKLFTGKADCDSVCALTAVLSLAGGVIALVDVQSFTLKHTFIYVTAALVSLLFNTLGKLYMISRAKRNFRFISGDSTKYYAQIVDNEASVSALTRAASERMPVIAAMRKTEFLTDFLKSSYCDDASDRLSVKFIIAATAAGVVTALLAFFNPFGTAFTGIDVGGAENPIYWAISSMIAIIFAASPFSMLLMINHPLNRASKQLNESNAALLGYEAAEKFSDVNTVMTDAKALFPAGSVVMHRVKRCQKKKSVIKISVEDAILMAASIAIHTDGILSYLFYDVTLGNKELLQKVDNCIYEDNCGITGWIGAKRVMLGGRTLMEMHHIDLPSVKNENKYCGDEFEPVYLAVSGEVVAMFVIGMSANPEIADCLKKLQAKGVALLVRTTDSIVTVEKLADLFDLEPSLISILPHDAHEEYSACTKYTSRGSGELSCGGTFTSFAKGILAAKSLAKDFIFAKNYVIASCAFGVLLALIMVLFKQTAFITPTAVAVYNAVTALILLLIQKFRKY